MRIARSISPAIWLDPAVILLIATSAALSMAPRVADDFTGLLVLWTGAAVSLRSRSLLLESCSEASAGTAQLSLVLALSGVSASMVAGILLSGLAGVASFLQSVLLCTQGQILGLVARLGSLPLAFILAGSDGGSHRDSASKGLLDVGLLCAECLGWALLLLGSWRITEMCTQDRR